MGALRPYPSLFLPNLLALTYSALKDGFSLPNLRRIVHLHFLHSRSTNLIHMTLNTDLVYQKCAALYRCSSCNHPSSVLIYLTQNTM